MPLICAYSVWAGANEATINIMCCNKYFPNRCLSKDMIRAILLSGKYFSQLATVSLLLLQFFGILIHFSVSVQIHTAHI